MAADQIELTTVVGSGQDNHIPRKAGGIWYFRDAETQDAPSN